MTSIKIVSDNDGGDGIKELNTPFEVKESFAESNYPEECCKENSDKFGIDSKGGNYE